jgi:23S rRNA (cytidine2498-2'-O)-methyltransferase
MIGLILSFDPKFDYCLDQELTELGLPTRSLQTLWPGVAFLPVADPAVQRLLLHETPVFLRHMFPVQYKAELTQDPVTQCSDFVASVLANLAPQTSVAVQSRVISGLPVETRAVKTAMDDIIRSMGHVPTIKHPSHIVSLVFTDDGVYAGFSTPADNLTDWSGGAVHYSQSGGMLSRAGHKLEEAIEVFRIDLGGLRLALDLGAAPGGFTRHLLSRGFSVTAVDTAEMDDSLRNHPQVVIYRDNAFGLDFRPGAFDIITCDISWDALRTARFLARLAPALVPGGILIMTVKFMGASPLKTIRAASHILGESYTLVKARQLWHNREEATLYLTRKDG